MRIDFSSYFVLHYCSLFSFTYDSTYFKAPSSHREAKWLSGWRIEAGLRMVVRGMGLEVYRFKGELSTRRLKPTMQPVESIVMARFSHHQDCD
jgi:hypothetical protein